ncbi:hypothetical protein CIB48_g10743 [Xylaria polymorpha]|nr:hypothetical protein CIB48_g10743 [Xylaria polymorpha]
MAVKPITGMLKRGLVVDLAIALGIGMTMGSAYWYGFHMPRTTPETPSTSNWKPSALREAAISQGAPKMRTGER